MKKNIVIVGSGQHAKVVLYNVICQNKYNVVGFISGCRDDVQKKIYDIPVIGTDDMIDNLIYEYCIKGYILGIGNIKARKKLIEYYDKRLEPVTIIHPQAVVSSYARIGEGTLIECGCLITPNPVIGRHCVINTMSGINHDNVLEDNVYIASGVTLSGGVEIQENTLIDDGVVITLGKKIGKRCIIGAGSVVTKDIPDDSVAYGIPSKIIRKNNFD
ncbi:acetyltransferase [Sporanaerobacter acetigenes]|uniref:acetyltransferase n=1 Tax=Sporanaerobacter acetigenes TaxID=165813 RepID=UPI0033186765